MENASRLDGGALDKVEERMKFEVSEMGVDQWGRWILAPANRTAAS